jgi:hypothetical protein
VGLLAAVGMVLGAGAAGAEEKDDTLEWPIQTFFLSDVAQVQEPGEVQGLALVSFRDTGDGTTLEALLDGEVGIGHGLQLSSGIEWARESESGSLERGLSEAEVGAQYRLLDSAERGLAISTGVMVVAARPALNEDRWTFLASLQAYKQLGAIGLNALVQPGLARPVDGSGLEPRANLGLGVAVGHGMVVPTGEVRADLGGEESFEAVGGLTVKPLESLQLGLGALVGRREGQDVLGAVTSLLWELGGK